MKLAPVLPGLMILAGGALAKDPATLLGGLGMTTFGVGQYVTNKFFERTPAFQAYLDSIEQTTTRVGKFIDEKYLGGLASKLGTYIGEKIADSTQQQNNK